MSTKAMSTKALNLLQRSKRTAEKAESYISRIARDMKRSKIEDLEDQISKIKDKIFDLENFNLSTNVNKGEVAATREQVLSNFNQIFELQMEMKIMEEQLALNEEIYKDYFENAVEGVEADSE